MIRKGIVRPKRYFLLAIILLCGGAAVLVTRHAGRTPRPRLLQLSDGTQIYALPGTRIEPSADYPNVREVKIGGEAFVRTPDAPQPLIIRTRVMALKITGSSALRVIGPDSDTGQEADVLYGQVEATKAYASPQNDPDILLAGQFVLVNQTIDLQERETGQVSAFQAWSDAFIASATHEPGH